MGYDIPIRINDINESIGAKSRTLAEFQEIGGRNLDDKRSHENSVVFDGCRYVDYIDAGDGCPLRHERKVKRRTIIYGLKPCSARGARSDPARKRRVGGLFNAIFIKKHDPVYIRVVE